MKKFLAIIFAALTVMSGPASAVRDYAPDLRAISMSGAHDLQIRLTSNGNALTGVMAKLPFGNFSVSAAQLRQIAFPDLGTARAMVNPGGAEVTLGPSASTSKWGPYYDISVRFYDSDYATEEEAPVLHIVFHADQATEMFVVRSAPCPVDRTVECKLDDRHPIPDSALRGRQPNKSFKPNPLRGSA